MPQMDYKFSYGLKQQADAEISEGLQEAENLSFETIGSVASLPINDVPLHMPSPVHSLGLEGLSTADVLLSGVGTDLYASSAIVKSGLSGKPLTFASLLGRNYIADPEGSTYVYNGVSTFLAGTPVPLNACSAAGGAAGNFTGTYTIYVTFVSDSGFDGNPSPSASTGAITNQKINLTNIPVYTGADYNVAQRNIWIQGGTTPSYSNVVLLYSIADNSTTSVSGIDVSDVDPLIQMETDNDLPPQADVICSHYGVLFFAKANDLYFSKTNAAEQVPLTNNILVSVSGDSQMWLVSWNGALWIPTRRRIFQLLGSPGQGTLLTNFYLKETQSEKGTIAGRSVQATPQGLVFQAEDGIRLFNGQSSVVFSNDVQTEIENRNHGDVPEALSVSAYWDDKYFLSYCAGNSVVPDRTLIYDFTRSQWSVHASGYRSFAVDRKNNVLYCGSAQGIERFGLGTGYQDWKLKKRFVNGTAFRSAWMKIQVDLEGSATARVYLDDVLRATYELFSPVRQFQSIRLPQRLSGRCDVELTGLSKSTRDRIYSIAVTGDGGRGQV